MRQVLAVALAGAVLIAMLGAVEVGARHWRIPPDDSRRLVHVSAALVAASLPLFMAFPSVVVLCAGFVAFMAVSRRVGLFPAVHGVERSTFGEVYFPIGVALAAAAFPHRIAYGYGVLVMGLSDAAASYAGQRYGRHAYRVLTSAKTYVGSGAFLATTTAISIGALHVGGRGVLPSVGIGVAMAAVLTVVEGVSGGGVDNAVLPVVGAALLTWVG